MKKIGTINSTSGKSNVQEIDLLSETKTACFISEIKSSSTLNNSFFQKHIDPEKQLQS